MLELTVVALLQAAAGPPAASPQQPAAEQTPALEAEAQADAEEPMARRWRCTIRHITGTRLQNSVTCRPTRSASVQDEETWQTLRRLQQGQAY